MGLSVLLLAAVHGIAVAEMVTLKTPGGSVRGEVIRATESEVVIKTTAGKQQTLPVAFLKPKEVYYCRKQVLPTDSAQAHFELGEYCLKNGLKEEGSLELAKAKRLDEKGFGAKVDALLKGGGTPKSTDVAQGKPPDKAGSATEKKDPASSEKPDQTITIRLPDGTVQEISAGEEGGENVKIRGRDGKTYLIPKQFLVNNTKIPERTPDQMKKFLDGRLGQLKEFCSGPWEKGEEKREWEMVETEHFYIFSNLKPELKSYFKLECEKLYTLLSEVLEHKEGAPLWNNKCPIYFLSNRAQFINFAVKVDKQPHAAKSGGYFSHRGRQVHIVIPLMARHSSEPITERVRRATCTLRHEGTHAFLQLVGNNVQLSRWLHEGMAQFIEFWYDPKNNPDRKAVEKILRAAVSQDQILSWKDGRNRPDIRRREPDRAGYAFAWSRIVYLYRAFQNDKRKLPRMIKLIKEGKTEEEAMEQAFGYPVEKLEEVYRKFLKQHAKTNFRGL